jgi:hypothetical protein
VLSLRHAEETHDRKSYESYVQKQRSDERTTIGDLFGHLFKDMIPAEKESAEEEATSETNGKEPA